MAFSSANLTSIETAIMTLATRESTEVEIDGRRVRYGRDDLPFLLKLKSAIQQDINAASDNGGLNLVKPMGRY